MKNKFFKKDELKLLWPFYIESLILSIFFIVFPFQVIYFLSLGFNLFQIGLLTSAQLLAGFLFEIPTGAVADIFGRKTSTIIGHFLAGLSILSIFFTNKFWLIFSLMFLWGFAQTFVSGAYEAWAVDKLKQKKKDKLVQEYYSKTHSFYNFSFLIAGVFGALLVKYLGLAIIWPVTSVCFFITGLMFLFVSEKHSRKKANLLSLLKDSIKQTNKAIEYSISHKNLKLLILGTIFLGAFVAMTTDLTWTAFFRNLGIQEHWLGYLFSATMVLGIFTPYFVKKIIIKFKGYRNLLIGIVYSWIVLLIVLLTISKLFQAITIFILYVALWDFYHPTRQPFFQSFVPSKMRATISSLSVQLRSFIGIIMTPLVGLIADKIGPQYTISLGVIFLLPVIYLYSKIKE